MRQLAIADGSIDIRHNGAFHQRERQHARIGQRFPPGPVEAERLRRFGEGFGPYRDRGAREVVVAGLCQRLRHVDAAVVLAVEVRHRHAENSRGAGAGVMGARIEIVHQGGRRGHHLHRGTGRVQVLGRAIAQRAVVAVLQGVEILLQRGRVEGRIGRQRENLARGRIKDRDRSAMAFQRRLGRLLQAQVQREREVVAAGRFAFQDAVQITRGEGAREPGHLQVPRPFHAGPAIARVEISQYRRGGASVRIVAYSLLRPGELIARPVEDRPARYRQLGATQASIAHLRQQPVTLC